MSDQKLEDSAPAIDQGGAGWSIRQPVRAPVVDAWDVAPPVDQQPAQPEAPPTAASAPTAEPVASGVASSPARRIAGIPPRVAAAVAGLLLVALTGGAAVVLLGHGSTAAESATGSRAPGIALVRNGTAMVSNISLRDGAQTAALPLTGAPDTVVVTQDHRKAFLLDTEHGDVVPLDLLSHRLGTPLNVGRLPVSEDISADGTTLYVTDNLDGTVIPVDIATGEVRHAQRLFQGVTFFVPSPHGSAAVVGAYTGEGQPGMVFIDTPGSGLGKPIALGSNIAYNAFFGADERTIWVAEEGRGNQPGVLIPLDAVTRLPGMPIVLGHGQSADALSPDRRIAVFGNRLDDTVSIIDLVAHRVQATVRVGAGISDIEISADGTTAWVACALDRTLVPVNLRTHRAGHPLSLPNAPAAIMLNAGGTSAWVLYPSSPGSVSFAGMHGFDRPVSVGNAPGVTLAPDGRTAWVSNGLSDTVQRVDMTAGTVVATIPVPRAPSAAVLTPDARTLLVLSYGDGYHPGYVTAIDTATSRAAAPLRVAASPSSLVVSPDGTQALVAYTQSRSITVIDLPHWRVSHSLVLPCSAPSLMSSRTVAVVFASCPSTQQLVPVMLAGYQIEAPLSVAANARLVMSGDGASLYVLGAGMLQRVDVAAQSVPTTQNETGNFVDAELTPNGAELVALDNSGGALVQLDPQTLVTLRSLAVAPRPDRVALSHDGADAYVLDKSEQKLFIVDLSIWKVVQTISVAPNAVALYDTPPDA